MANYKVNEKSKTISVSGMLTPIENSIISSYINAGYQIKEKRKVDRDPTIKLTDDDIINYFDSKEDKTGKANYLAQKKTKVKDKNGKLRQGGFFKGLKWFKENYPNAYKALLDSKKPKDEEPKDEEVSEEVTAEESKDEEVSEEVTEE